MTITLEAIKEKHTEITKMIATFEKQPVLPVFPMQIALPELRAGERHVAAIVSADGSRRYHLILLPEKASAAPWNDQMAWAKSVGGDLFDRPEGALIYALMKDEFEEEAYWTNTQHAADSDYAWFQTFGNGYQTTCNRSGKLRARAGRRLVIQ